MKGAKNDTEGYCGENALKGMVTFPSREEQYVISKHFSPAWIRSSPFISVSSNYSGISRNPCSTRCLYRGGHGNNHVISRFPDKSVTPEYGLGNDKHDYGRGFYLTTNVELAKEWAVCRPDESNGWSTSTNWTRMG